MCNSVHIERLLLLLKKLRYGMMVLEMVGGRKNESVGVEQTSEIYFPHRIYKRLELRGRSGAE